MERKQNYDKLNIQLVLGKTKILEKTKTKIKTNNKTKKKLYI